jgi:hypothetical protein
LTRDPDDKDEGERALERPVARAIEERGPEPPVVARLVVEIRSDGSRTVARGAMEDLATGQRVAIEAKGTTPLALALELAKSMFNTRAIMGSVARRFLGGAGRDRDKK